jgi:hypothetical protein
MSFEKVIVCNLRTISWHCDRCANACQSVEFCTGRADAALFDASLLSSAQEITMKIYADPITVNCRKVLVGRGFF